MYGSLVGCSSHLILSRGSIRTQFNAAVLRVVMFGPVTHRALGSRPMIHRSKKRPPRFNSRRTASCPWNPAGNPWRCGRVIWHGVCHQAQVAAQGGRLLEALEMLQAERTERWMRKRIKFCCGALNRKTEGCGLTLSVVESQVDNPFFLQESHGKSRLQP